MSDDYASEAPTQEAVAALPGATVLDFGTNWCGYCRAARPVIDAAFAGVTGVRHLRLEDGRGRPLGRAYGVKLWPTLVFLRDGAEVERLVRPDDPAAVRAALARIGAV